ncbi:hypothetical protein PAXRUDRAFT_136499 [Paxillus rubicundulus Ve08.2h10]|uniref:CMP/dCMP-type deaminase domain-containing protein n=1 Tax=Paxillus rubicundulus Ve08.2h10 TaxID=930991 RepID=A0A0D0DGZ2_9AGAM|nr:hypothetical protein PAXRUDRAFT_136499 [Paxillus rubicundulus Ve08.2h10]
MHKSQYYFSQCLEAASKSPMAYTLGAVLVKGGKVISTGHNHHRTHYDGNDVRTHGHRKPVSMHAEMHAIFSFTGAAPSFKQQVQARGARNEGEKRGRGSDSSDGWSRDARRRDARVNGADLYVVRVVKSRTGSAKPCWRCVRWCSWSGVRRIFHWNPVEGRFDVVKVNSVEEGEVYETQADTRLFAGAVSR